MGGHAQSLPGTDHAPSQERGRGAGWLPVLRAAHHHRRGHLRHGTDQGGDRQRELGAGTRGRTFRLLQGDAWAWLLLSPPWGGPLLASGCSIRRAWPGVGGIGPSGPTGELPTHLLSRWVVCSRRPPLAPSLAARSPQPGQVENVGGPGHTKMPHRMEARRHRRGGGLAETGLRPLGL